MQKKQYLEKILNNINEGIHIIDEEGRTIIYNRKMAELENMKPETVLGKKLLSVFPSLTEETSTLLRTLKMGEMIENKEQEYLNKYGQKITTINTTIPIDFEDGTRWAVEIAKDITEIKNLYNKIIKLQERLYGKEKENSLFTFDDIKGKDEAFTRMINYARQAAMTDSSVLISGETGTGKELVAQSIHSASHRKNKPFIAQNCAALPENLLEGILFGTRKGGFTGAINRKGLFEQADGGTLLLDEINSLSPSLQAKLLRVLQEGLVRPVGGKKDIKVDVRIIATTNVLPLEAIRTGRLREDLYYRLAVVSLHLPPLSERGKDINLLTDYFIEKYNRKLACQVTGVAPEVRDLFQNYSWPGNVRQLEHIIEGALNIIGKGRVLQPEHVQPFLLEVEEKPHQISEVEEEMSLPERLAHLEKKYIKKTLKDTDGNITEAAKKLGISRQSLQYRLEKYDLK